MKFYEIEMFCFHGNEWQWVYMNSSRDRERAEEIAECIERFHKCNTRIVERMA